MKIVIVLKRIFLIFLICVLLFVSLLFYRGSTFDKESKEYARTSILMIAEGWKKQELTNRATPELAAILNTDKLNDLFEHMSGLGKIISCENPAGESMLWFHSENGTFQDSASYKVKANFENGSAIFSLTLLRPNGTWMINYFSVKTSYINKNTNI